MQFKYFAEWFLEGRSGLPFPGWRKADVASTSGVSKEISFRNSIYPTHTILPHVEMHPLPPQLTGRPVFLGQMAVA